MPDVTVVIVNRDTEKFLRDCLHSLAPSIARNICSVIVIDNGSSDGSVAMVQQMFPNVELMAVGANLGFARANNIGINKANTPYVLLLNSDTIVEPDTLAGMLAVVKAQPDIKACGCNQVDGMGRTQKGFGHFPSLRSELITLTGAFKWPLVRHLIDLRARHTLAKSKKIGVDAASSSFDKICNPKTVSVDWVSGACMLLDRQFVIDLGGLDEEYFFYAEDIDLCMRIKKNGGEVAYTPDISIIHYGGGSSGKNYLPLLRQYIITRHRFFRKHYGRAATVMLGACYCLAGLLSVIKWSSVYVGCASHRDDAAKWLQFWLGFIRRSYVEDESRRLGRL